MELKANTNGQRAALVVGSPHKSRPCTSNTGQWRWGLILASQAYPVNTPTFLYGVEHDPKAPGGDLDTTAGLRNDLVKVAQEKHAKWIWMVDDDTIPLRCDAVRMLISTLEQHRHEGVKAVTGIYVTKSSVHEPVVFRKDGEGPSWDWKVGEVFPVESAGAGCLLISMDVFDTYTAPWFKGEHGKEDLYFCGKLRELGYKMLAHGGVLCAHFDGEGEMHTLPEDSYPMLKSSENVTFVKAG